jgi:hypothetical protein
MLALIGWVVAIVVAASAWDAVRDAPVAVVDKPLNAGGQSVAVFTDVKQPERKIACEHTTEADRKAKKEPRPIPRASIELAVTDDGSEWHLIGFEPDGRNDMAISCGPADKRSDNATYAFSVVDGFTSRANTGNGIAIITTALAFGLAIWTFIARRRRLHQETDDAST